MAKYDSILALIQKEFTLDHLVCIADIETNTDKKSYSEMGYNVGFTRAEWEHFFPEVSPRFIFANKGTISGPNLLYYDKEKHILFSTMLFGSKHISLKEETQEEAYAKAQAEILEQRKRREENYREKNWIALLSSNYSESSGNIIMSLIRDIVETEDPSPDIYKAFINYYVMCDCGAEVLSPEMIDRITACKGSSQKAKTEEALKPFDDIITIYRGQGSKSTPATSAYSWTVNIQTAYKFAGWRGGERACIVTARVRKQDVLEYTNERSEYEIVVSPKFVFDIQVDNCCEFDYFAETVTNMALPATQLPGKYNSLTIISKTQAVYRRLPSHSDHDMDHSMRVSLLANYLFRVGAKKLQQMYGCKAKDIDRTFNDLITAAIWHDVGRINDNVDITHGAASYQQYVKSNKQNDVISFLTTYHCLPDEEGEQYIRENFPDSKQPLMKLAFFALKDADALDRWRFGPLSSDFVQVSSLRLPESPHLMPVAATLADSQLY